MGDNDKHPKLKKAVQKFDFNSAFTDTETAPTPADNKQSQTKKPIDHSQFNYESAFEEPVKKKDGTPDSTIGSQIGKAISSEPNPPQPQQQDGGTIPIIGKPKSALALKLADALQPDIDKAELEANKEYEKKYYNTLDSTIQDHAAPINNFFQKSNIPISIQPTKSVEESQRQLEFVGSALKRNEEVKNANRIVNVPNNYYVDHNYPVFTSQGNPAPTQFDVAKMSDADIEQYKNLPDLYGKLKTAKNNYNSATEIASSIQNVSQPLQDQFAANVVKKIKQRPAGMNDQGKTGNDVAREIGETIFKSLHPDDYALYQKAGGYNHSETESDQKFNSDLDQINKTIMTLGYHALKQDALMTGDDAYYENLDKNIKSLNYRFSTPLEEDTKHRIAVYLYKHDISPDSATEEEKDNAARQLPLENQEVWFNKTKPTGITFLPSTGFLYSVGQSAKNVLTNAGTSGSPLSATALSTMFLGTPTNKETAQEVLRQRMTSNVLGENPESIQELEGLRETQKQRPLTKQEQQRLNDLETYTDVRSGWDKFRDGNGNMVGMISGITVDNLPFLLAGNIAARNVASNAERQTAVDIEMTGRTEKAAEEASKFTREFPGIEKPDLKSTLEQFYVDNRPFSPEEEQYITQAVKNAGQKAAADLKGVEIKKFLDKAKDPYHLIQFAKNKNELFVLMHHDNQTRAMELFPEDETKRSWYTAITDVLPMVIPNVLPVNKLSALFDGETKDVVKDLVSKMTAKDIDAAVIKNTMSNVAKKVIGKVGSAVVGAEKTAAEVALTIGLMNLGNDITKSILKPDSVKPGDIANNFLQTFSSTFMDSQLIGIIGGVSNVKNQYGKVGADAIYDATNSNNSANSVKYTIEKQVKDGLLTQDQANDKISILNTARNLRPAINTIQTEEKLNDSQAKRLFVNLLNKRILTERASKIDDAELKAPIEKRIKEIEELNKKIVGKEVDVDRNYSTVEKPTQNENSNTEGKVPEDQKTKTEEAKVEGPESKNAEDKVPIVERDNLLNDAKDIVNTDVVKGYTADVLKEAANSDPAKFESHLKDISEQANDEKSNKATVDTYGQPLVDIAQKLFPKASEQTAGPKNAEPKLSDNIKNKFTNFKSQLENENVTPKEQTATGSIEQGGDQVSKGNTQEGKIKVLKKRAKSTIKSPLYLKALSADSQDPHTQVLQYFIAGGKVHTDVIKELLGNKKKSIVGELRSKLQLLGKDAPKTADALAHYLWDNSPEEVQSKYDTQDFRNAVEDVLLNHNARTTMAEEVVKGNITPEEKEMSDWYNKTYGGHEGEFSDEAFDLSINHLENVDDEERQRIADANQEELDNEELPFQVSEPTPDHVDQMKDIVKDLINEGVTKLSDVHDIAKKELGEHYNQDLVDKGFTEAMKDKDVTPKEVTGGVIGKVGKFLSRIFGGKGSDKVFIAKDTKSLQEKADQIAGEGGKVAFQKINDDTEAFYSPLEKFIEKNPQNSFTPEQVLGQVKNLPQAEIEAIGLKDFLKGKTKVTKQELLDYVRDNKVNVEVVVKGGGERNIDTRMGEIQHTFSTAGYDIGVDMAGDVEITKNGEYIENPEKQLTPELYALAQEYFEITEDPFARRDDNNNTQYSTYTLPGEKSNYREVLLTMQSKKIGISETPSDIAMRLYGKNSIYDLTAPQQKEAMKIYNEGVEQGYKLKRNQYRSSHFDELNIVAHLRLTDRVTPEGKRILFVEETQSDWAREGRQKGFATITELPKEYRVEPPTKFQDWAVVEPSGVDGNLQSVNVGMGKTKEEAIQRALENLNRRRIPDLPFKNDKWIELATKKAIQIASQEGYDGIAWINGEQTKDRYDLSKQVDYIQHEDAPNNTKYVDIGLPDGLITLRVDKDGKILENQNRQINAIGKNLSDVIGKDVSQKILNSPKFTNAKDYYEKYWRKEVNPNAPEWKDLTKNELDAVDEEFKNTKNRKRLEGLDLKVGGDWANNLYDKQIPKLAEKYAKQYGGKVSSFEIDQDKTAQSTERNGGRYVIEDNDSVWKGYATKVEAQKELDKLHSNGETEYKIVDRGGQEISKQFGLEITPDMKGKTKSLPLFMYGDVKTAKSEYDKAVRELKNAEDKIAQKQATQTGMFADRGAQGELFGVGRDEAKNILDPLRLKVKEAKAAWDKEQSKAINEATGQQPSLFMKGEREILGFTHDGKIYLNGEYLNPNTPIHESGHVWTELAKEKRPLIYKKGIELITNSRYLKEIKASDFYKAEASKLPESEREQYYQHEALAKAIGDKGAQIVGESRKSSFREWLDNLWTAIKNITGFNDLSNKEFQNLTLDEFSQKAVKDILDEPKDVSRETEPPKPPPTLDEIKSPKEEWSAITKARLQEIDGVKKMFDDRGKKQWAGIIDDALQNLQSLHPDKSLYEAARHEVNNAAAYFDKGFSANPTSEQLAVYHYFKLETERRINDIKGWDSEDEIPRQAAMLMFRGLSQDLVNVSKAINPSEAGRAFGFRRSLLSYDPDYGLKIKRLELQESNGGQKLSDEDMEWTADMWQKEKDLMQRESEAREEKLKREFEKQLSDLKKEYEDKLKKGAKPTKADNREKLLSQKGKEFADKLRSGKLKGGTYATLPGLPQAVNLVIEAIAQIVEKGATLAEAISQYVKDNNIKDENKFRDTFLGVLENMQSREDAFEKIKEHAEVNSVTAITTDMVAKNLIRDYVDSHIGEHETKDILDVATKGLKKILPDVTKEQLRDAYLKDGEFKQPTKEQANKEFKEAKARLERLTRLEKDIDDLKNNRQLNKRSGNVKKENEIDQEISKKEKQLRQELIKQGVKLSNESQFSKAENNTRAQAHNQRVDDLSKKIQEHLDNKNITPEQRTALLKLKTQLEGATIKLDENSRLAQKPIMEQGLNIIKSTLRDFERNLNSADRNKLGNILRGLQGLIDKFEKDKDQSDQRIKLEVAKKREQSIADEYERKINAGEFDEGKKSSLGKEDAELIKLQIERQKQQSEYRKKQKEVADKNKTKFEKAVDYARGLYVAGLIWKFGTFWKVTTLAAVRSSLEAATKLTTGKLTTLALPTFAEAAKGGGESTSLSAIAKSYEAQFRSIGEKKMAQIYEKSSQEYEDAARAYYNYKRQTDKIKVENPAKAKDADQKLQQLKSDMDKKKLAAVGNFVYQFIGSSNLKDVWDALLHRTNSIEREFGFYNDESFKTKEGKLPFTNYKIKYPAPTLETLNYAVGFIGRSHSALKTFSARANFAAAFMARLEYAQSVEGKDISDPDTVIEIANNSYLDWDRGKYQQSNFISDFFQNIVNKTEKFGEGKKKSWQIASKVAATLLRFDVAITRVPINILHEAVVEYTFGAFKGAYLAAKEYLKARKDVKINDNLLPDEKEFKEALRERLQGMDKDQAATIIRCFRKGGFGLGLFALVTLSGYLHFGGFHHKGEKKKKESELEPDELNPGEIMFGNTRLGKIVSSIAEHFPVLYPSLFAANAIKVYHDKVERGESTWEAGAEAAQSNLEALQDAIPQSKLLNPIQLTKDVGRGFVRSIASGIAQFQPNDIDDLGNTIVRKPLDFKDQINLMIGKRGKVLSEDNFKTASSVLKRYANDIHDLYQIKPVPKDEIEQLKKQRDEEIDNIYKLNEQEYEQFQQQKK